MHRSRQLLDDQARDERIPKVMKAETWKSSFRLYAIGSVISTVISIPESAIYFAEHGVGFDAGSLGENIMARTFAVAATCAASAVFVVPSLVAWVSAARRHPWLERDMRFRLISLLLLGVVCGAAFVAAFSVAVSIGHFDAIDRESIADDAKLSAPFIAYVALAVVLPRMFPGISGQRRSL